jgi:parallel beta-helix repeat protein
LAISASTVWNVRSDGADTNGGGFVAGASGTDWTKQAAAQYSVTDGVTNGTTTITSATANFGTDVVGNLIYVSGGTGSVAAGWYEIASRTNSTTIVVDRSTGLTAGTGVTLKIGGALLTPATANAQHIAGNTVHFKNGSTYNLTGTALTWTADKLAGYTATFDDGGIAVFDASGMTATNNTFNNNRDHSWWSCLRINNSTAKAFNNTSGTWSLSRCVAVSATTIGFNGSADYVRCEAISCTSHGFSVSTSDLVGCVSIANGGLGFNISGKCNFTRCIASHNTGDNFGSGGELCRFDSCIAYGGTLDGFDFSRSSYLTNCIAYGNLNFGARGSSSFMESCAFGSNSSGPTSGLPTKGAEFNRITLTANPFVDPDNATIALRNFALNNTAGGGALLRGLGFPNTWSYLTGTTAYSDGGAVQHQDPPARSLQQTCIGTH